MLRMNQIFKLGLGYLTLAWTIFATLAIALSSFIAISKKHVYPWLPSISDTTVENPEGPIFAICFNITAFLTVSLMSVRFLHVKMLVQRTPQLDVIAPNLSRLNVISLVLGCTSSLGITIVANFRIAQDDDSSMVTVHDIGAVLLFVGGAAYCCVQTIITYHLFRIELNSLLLFIVRLVCSALLVIGVATFFVVEVFAYDDFVRSGSPRPVPQWRPGDGGYSLHVLSNMGEWISVWCFGIFVITYCNEFKKFTLSVQCIPKCPGGKKSKFTRYESISASDEGGETE